MPRRAKRDDLADARQTVEDAPLQATDEPSADLQTHNDGKNAAAVELGRLGGKKGGAARAAKLTKERRSEIAKKAAQARWAKKSAQPSSGGSTSSGGVSE